MDIECKTKKTSYDEKPALEIDAQTEKITEYVFMELPPRSRIDPWRKCF